MHHHPVHEVDVDDMPEEPGVRAEWLAQRLMRRWLQADVEQMDVPGGRPGMFDFEVRHDDGQRDAVEVRACVNRAAREFDHALAQHGSVYPAEDLSRSWHVLLQEEARVEGRHEVVIPALKVLESMRFTASAAPDPPTTSAHYLVRDGDEAICTPEPPEEVQRLHDDLGVVNAWSTKVPAGERATVELARQSVRSGSRREHLVTAEAEAAAAEKLAVLSSEESLARDERHLFVWLGTSHCVTVEVALWTGYCGDAPPPDVPAPITRVWVAGWSLTPEHGVGRVIAWTAERSSAWNVVE